MFINRRQIMTLAAGGVAAVNAIAPADQARAAADHKIKAVAFDGFPIYGPYEAAGVMAKDSTSNPLNAFNACYDAVRGWHYHVTPGKFPYIIGGYFAKIEPGNFERPPLRPSSDAQPFWGPSPPPPAGQAQQGAQSGQPNWPNPPAPATSSH